MIDGKEFLSVKEFASKMGLHPNTIRKFLKEKRIDYIRIGKTKKAVYRIPVCEITRIMKFELDIYIDHLVDEREKQRKLKEI